MRFWTRFLLGFVFLAAGVAVAGLGAIRLSDSLAERRAASETRAPEKRERVFAVSTDTIRNERISPQITAYGDIRSWRTLELRASTAGRVVDLSEAFRDGIEVAEGDFLFRIDPRDYETKVADASAAVAEAEADLREAVQGVEVSRRELTAAETQRDLRATALKRQTDLRNRGVATSSGVEEAELSVASAEQTAASRAQMLLAAEIKIDRNKLRLQRARIALEDAERTLADTEHRAPFGGFLSSVSIALGELASTNESFGELIDPSALEAVFRVTNAQFARLLDDRGVLRPTDITVSLDLDDQPLLVRGVINRSGAVVEAGETGRLIYARLELDSATLLRPGDFVTILIEEQPLDNVARVPAAAVSEDGELLIVDEDLRLSALQTRILRRVDEDVIVSGAPDGATYVTSRAPQLGKGVKVRIIGDDAAAAPADRNLVALEPAQQKKLIAYVEASDRIPADRKTRILTRLRTGKAPQRMIDRLSQPAGG